MAKWLYADNKAWGSIPDKTFLNCFKKYVEKPNDDEDSFGNLNEKDVMESLQGELQLLKE